MAEVINSFQIKGRTERIDMIVKCAVRHLGVQGVTGAGVQAVLSSQGVGGGSKEGREIRVG